MQPRPPFEDQLTPRSGVEFGDRVRIRTTPVTVEAGIAGRVGLVYGHTTPSHGYVSDVLGDPIDDVAINVDFFDDAAVWITPDLVEFVDHAPGTTMGVGDTQVVRQADGSWRQSSPSSKGGPR